MTAAVVSNLIIDDNKRANCWPLTVIVYWTREGWGSPPPHIPYISSPNQCLLFATRAHTIATCFPTVSIISSIPERKTRNRWYHIDTTAKQVAMVWACVAKRRHWLGEEMNGIKCMEYEVEGSRPRGRPKRTWREVVQKDCQARNLNREDAMDRSRWKKLIKIGWWSGSGWWVGECFFWYWLTWVVPDKGP